MRTGRAGRRLLVPVILILLGSVFLLQHRGMLPAQFAQDWWPLLLVVAGLVLLARRIALRR